MGRLLAFDLDPRSLDVLRQPALDLGVELEPEKGTAAARLLGQIPSDVEAVLIGEVDEPVQLAQKSHLHAPEVPVLMVSSNEERSRSMTEVLRFAPLVGNDVTSIATQPEARFVQTVRNVLQQSRTRRRHRQTISVLNRKLVEMPPAQAPAAALLGRILDIAPIGIAITTETGEVRAVNPRGQELIQRTEREILGQKAWSSFPRSQWVRAEALLSRLGDTQQDSEILERSDGTRTAFIELTGTRIGANAGGPGFLLIFQDVTERLELLTKLDAANRRKDEFLAMLGHELRNPLAPIRTALELMRLRQVSGAEREREIIERHVNHVVQLVDDLLDVSRITRGKIELRRRPVSIQEVITEAIEMASPLLEARRHELRLDIGRDDLIVEGDAGRLSQVIANLLTNAAKYTDPGGQVRVAATREDDQVIVSVQDDGRGIDPEILPDVFELFVQSKQALDRSMGGLGIGLAIVRSLVELHGGTVSARSELGRGTEMTVRLPAAATSAPVVPSRPPAPAAAQVPNARRVLVVDDNKDAALLLGELVESFGCEVAVAFDGPSALEKARTFKPQIALLDIGLPVMDGYELARRLLALPGAEGLRLAAVTGYGQPEDRAQSAAAGFCEHLVKPIQLERVRAVVERLSAAVAQER